MAIKTRRFYSARKSCSCSMPGVWRAVAYMDGAVVVFHSPRACAHVARTMDINSQYRTLSENEREQWGSVPLLSSQIARRMMTRVASFRQMPKSPRLLSAGQQVLQQQHRREDQRRGSNRKTFVIFANAPLRLLTLFLCHVKIGQPNQGGQVVQKYHPIADE